MQLGCRGNLGWSTVLCALLFGGWLAVCAAVPTSTPDRELRRKPSPSVGDTLLRPSPSPSGAVPSGRSILEASTQPGPRPVSTAQESARSRWWGSFYSAFAGAAGGAAAVFLIQLVVERRRRRREEVRELRQIQFALIRRYANLHMLWDQWLKGSDTLGPFYWLLLQPPFVIVPSPSLRLEGIGFAAEDDPNLINMILRDEENLEVVLQIVHEFSANRHLISERVEKWEREAGSATALDRIPSGIVVELAGPRLSEVQRKFVNTLITRIPDLRESFFQRADEVGAYIVKQYGTRPLRMARLPETQGESREPSFGP